METSLAWRENGVGFKKKNIYIAGRRTRLNSFETQERHKPKGSR